MSIKYHSHIQLNDDNKIIVGTGGDGEIYSGGLHLTLANVTSDADILFKGNDGGSTITALALDMSDAGTATFNHHVSIPDYIVHTGDASTRFGFSGSSTYVVNTGGTTALTIDSSQNATFAGAADISGVLTTAGGIAHTGDTDTLLEFTSANVLKLKAGGATHLYCESDQSTHIYSGNTTAISCDTSQNVSIPGGALSISGDGSNAATLTETGAGILTIATVDALVLDSADDITLDAAGNDVLFKDAGTHIGTINMSSSNLTISSSVDDKDIIFKGKDGGSDITALTLDMSDAGKAVFNAAFGSTYLSLDNNGITQWGAGRGILTWSSGYASVYASSGNELWLGSGGSSDKSIVLDGSTIEITTPTNFGVDDTGYDVKFFGATAGSFMLWDESDDSLELTDSTYIKLGDSGDFKMWHDGSNTYLSNEGVGHVYIQNTADDKDIIFKSDDNSGGATEYFRLDGSSKLNVFSQHARVEDNIMFQCGGGNDLRMYHDGTDSLIKNATGNLYVRNTTDDGDIIFQADDGSGGDATYFKLDGSAASGGSLYTQFPDNSILSFGSSDDLGIKHDGTDSKITNSVGDLVIRNLADDKDIILQSDDGSGGVTAYLTLDGSVAKTQVSKPLLFIDNISAEYGTGTDMIMYHSGSHGYIENYTGDLKFIQNADDANISFFTDNGSGGTTEYFRIDGEYQKMFFYENARFIDSKKLYFGTSDDLSIYHDGTHSYIRDVGTGSLYLQTNGSAIYLQDTDGNAMAQFTDCGGSFLIYNSNLKLSTTNTGIEVTGEVQGDTLNIDGTADIAGNTAITSNTPVLTLGISNTSTGNAKIQMYSKNTSSNGFAIQYNKNGSGASEDRLEFIDGSGSANFIFNNGGTATFASNLTLGGIILDGNTITGVDDSGEFTDDDAHIMTSAGVLDKIQSEIASLVDSAPGTLNTLNELAAALGDDASFSTTVTNSIATKLPLAAGSGSPLTGDLHINHDGGSAPIKIDIHNTGTNTADDALIAFETQGAMDWAIGIDRSDSNKFKISRSSTLGTNDVFSLLTNDATFAGKVITTEVESAGALLLDAAADITIDAGGGDIILSDDATIFGTISSSGGMQIRSRVNNADMFLRGVDDGVEFDALTFNMSEGGNATFAGHVNTVDDKGIYVGTGLDFGMYHDGTHTYVTNDSVVGSNLYIRNATNDADTIFQGDDGSGGLATYLTIDGSATRIVFEKLTRHNDSVNANFGTDSDLRIYHDSSNSYIEQSTGATGDLIIQQKVDDKDIIFKSDDGSGGLAAYLTLDGTNVRTKFHKTVNLEDDVQLQIGNSQDLKLYHNGSHSYIAQAGVGNLYIQNEVDDGDIVFISDDGSGGVETYFFLDGSANINSVSRPLSIKFW